MLRILGIDPGSRITGYGVIEVAGGRASHVASGCIRTEGRHLPERLKVIFEEISTIVATYAPQEMAVEQVFVHKNVDSALKLGQARGAAICAGVVRNLTVAEYTPREIKQAIVGTGGAAKEQIQHMVTRLLKLSEPPQADAADALAVALCHSHVRQTLARMAVAPGVSYRRFR